MLCIHESQLPSTPLAEGGEGILYEWENGTLIKVFKKTVDLKEKKKKIERLLTKKLPQNVIRPLDIVYNQQQQFIGYVMKKAEGEELRKLSNKKYISINQITIQDILHMMHQIKEVLKSLHKQNIYIGDLNDSNLLFNEQNQVVFIDVDSWAIDELPCNVCMETFKDPLLKQNHFNEQTDTYAFAILFFKALTRLHPFGGTIATDMDILERMKKGISVMKPDVKIPRNVNDWSFFPPKIVEKLTHIFHEKKRFLLDQEIDEFQKQLVFCSKHGDYYFKQYNQCPVCHKEAKVVVVPTKIESAGKIPLTLFAKPTDIVAFINANSYLNTHNQIVDMHSKQSYPYVRKQEIYFSNDGAFVYRVYPSKIEVCEVKTNQLSVFEKTYHSFVLVDDRTMYYQGNNLTLYQVTVSEKGNVSKTIAKTAFRLYFHVENEKQYALMNVYDAMTIFNINGYHVQLPKKLEIVNAALHHDMVTNRWLVVVETKTGKFHTYVFDNDQVIYEADNLHYHTSLHNITFYNNTIFTPQEGCIRGLHIEKFNYKDFLCSVVNEDSKLLKNQKHFLILNEKECYKFG